MHPPVNNYLQPQVSVYSWWEFLYLSSVFSMAVSPPMFSRKKKTCGPLWWLCGVPGSHSLCVLTHWGKNRLVFVLSACVLYQKYYFISEIIVIIIIILCVSESATTSAAGFTYLSSLALCRAPPRREHRQQSCSERLSTPLSWRVATNCLHREKLDLLYWATGFISGRKVHKILQETFMEEPTVCSQQIWVTQRGKKHDGCILSISEGPSVTGGATIKKWKSLNSKALHKHSVKPKSIQVTPRPTQRHRVQEWWNVLKLWLNVDSVLTQSTVLNTAKRKENSNINIRNTSVKHWQHKGRRHFHRPASLRRRQCHGEFMCWGKHTAAVGVIMCYISATSWSNFRALNLKI